MSRPENFSIAMDPRGMRQLLRADLTAFIERCFLELNPSTAFLPNWHVELIANKLEACRRGEIRRLILNIPPRHLKSICASIALPAYWLGHDPSAQILCVSYAQDLANKLSMDCRQVMMSPWYQELFPTRLSSQRAAREEFATTKHGFRLASSVGGVLTGRGADVIIIDDPLKPDEALSEAMRPRVNEWYDQVLYSRLNHKEQGCIILVMQRLHLDDLVGHVLEQEGWDVVSLPAIAQEDERHLIHTLGQTREQARPAGEALHPERESLGTLDQIRKSMGDYAFAGQYLQAPVPLGGGMVKDVWWRIFEGDPGPYDRVIQSWDTANTAGELSDYSVCTTWGLKGQDAYLLHVLRKRLNYPDLKRAVREQAAFHRSQVILIEDKASGTSLIQDLRNDGLSSVQGCKPEGDKIMRLHAQTAWIENGRVYLPKAAPWLADYRHELGSFPKSKFDDQVDSTSQALAWIQKGAFGLGRIRMVPRRVSPELDAFLGGFGPRGLHGYSRM